MRVSPGGGGGRGFSISFLDSSVLTCLSSIDWCSSRLSNCSVGADAAIRVSCAMGSVLGMRVAVFIAAKAARSFFPGGRGKQRTPSGIGWKRKRIFGQLIAALLRRRTAVQVVVCLRRGCLRCRCSVYRRSAVRGCFGTSESGYSFFLYGDTVYGRTRSVLDEPQAAGGGSDFAGDCELCPFARYCLGESAGSGDVKLVLGTAPLLPGPVCRNIKTNRA